MHASDSIYIPVTKTCYLRIYLTIVPRARVSYNHFISNKREWNSCFIKNNHEILLNLANFALQEQPEENLMVAISRPWYNDSYTMAVKPIKSLELHYTMIQFLIIRNMSTFDSGACGRGLNYKRAAREKRN